MKQNTTIDKGNQHNESIPQYHLHDTIWVGKHAQNEVIDVFKGQDEIEWRSKTMYFLPFLYLPEITLIKFRLFCLIASCREKTWMHQFSFRFVEEYLKKKNSFPQNVGGEDNDCHTWSRRWRSYTNVWPSFSLFKEFMLAKLVLYYILLVI